MLRRCLGQAKNEGNDRMQWVLTKNGQVIPWCMLQKLTEEQLAPSNEVEQQKQAFFDADTRQILGDSFQLLIDGMHLETRDVIKK